MNKGSEEVRKLHFWYVEFEMLLDILAKVASRHLQIQMCVWKRRLNWDYKW